MAMPLIADPGTVFHFSWINLLFLLDIVTRLTGEESHTFASREIHAHLLADGQIQPSRNYLELAALGQTWLNEGIYAHHRFFHRNIAEQLTGHHELGGYAFTDGWDCPSEALGTGRYFSARSFGFGRLWRESLWVDPDKELVVAIDLAPDDLKGDPKRLVKLRSALHDAVIEGLGIAPPH